MGGVIKFSAEYDFISNKNLIFAVVIINSVQ